MNDDLVKRVEALEAKLAEYKYVASAIDTQWAESQDEIADLKAQLKKAMAALDEAMYFLDIDEDDILSGGPLYEAVKTYAELGGSMSSEFSDALKKMNRQVDG